MMANILGITPDAYQQTQQELGRKQAIEFAKLDPYERVNAMAYMQGRNLGTALGGLFGIEDPAMKLISTRNAVMRGVDQNDPDALTKAALELTNRGDIIGAFGITQQAQTLRKQITDLAKTAAETQETLVKTAKGNVDLLATTGAVQTLTGMGLERDKALAVAKDPKSVSYTHLTLPTKA